MFRGIRIVHLFVAKIQARMPTVHSGEEQPRVGSVSQLALAHASVNIRALPVVAAAYSVAFSAPSMRSDLIRIASFLLEVLSAPAQIALTDATICGRAYAVAVAAHDITGIVSSIRTNV